MENKYAQELEFKATFPELLGGERLFNVQSRLTLSSAHFFSLGCVCTQCRSDLQHGWLARLWYDCSSGCEGTALFSNKSPFKWEHLSVWALKGNCLNSIKVATQRNISWDFTEKWWPSVWNPDGLAKREALLWAEASLELLNYCCVFCSPHHSLAL